MKPYQRRAIGQVRYYKLATYDPRVHTFRDGRAAYPTATAAYVAAARVPGCYRICTVDDGRRRDGEPFTIA